ncbi:unnamed protein product [Medioppia subpectinata]|uniref:Uncharacterized protein n=1 Tax=Medioppia subpectinata TaxID=1979941 RepID=A0A7R9KJE0_9ACAR|nr:unnamed protein product [Medioppia subpectinata]CAG2104350.1 unnamed protein product [Medioppia subpectinata]
MIVLSVSIHLIAVSLYGFSLIFQFVYPSGYYPKPQTDDQTINSTDTKDFSFGWKYKYLTFWNMNFQFIIFAIHLLCDCFKVHYLPSKAIESRFTKHLFRIRDTLFHSVLFPIGWSYEITSSHAFP